RPCACARSKSRGKSPAFQPRRLAENTFSFVRTQSSSSDKKTNRSEPRCYVMKINQPGGHLDQMMRQTRSHHVQLSSMADMKANFLLTMSAVVITLCAPRVLQPDVP